MKVKMTNEQLTRNLERGQLVTFDALSGWGTLALSPHVKVIKVFMLFNEFLFFDN